MRDVLSQPPAVLLHGLADTAGVVSHQANGQPFAIDLRMRAIPPDVAEAMIEALTPYATNVPRGTKPMPEQAPGVLPSPVSPNELPAQAPLEANTVTLPGAADGA